MFSLRNLSKAYQAGDQQQQVLHQLNLDLQQGSFAAILGPSGCGKSTLLNICGLITPPDQGQILWQGQELSALSANQLSLFRRRYLGYIFQSYQLIPVMSAWDNVAYPLMLLNTPKALLQQRVATVLDQVGLAGMEHKRPQQLSGGQQQRVAIARALVKQPQLIIADEPTANLDADTALVVTRLLHKLCRQYRTTVLIATHDARLMPWCDQIFHIERGHLVQEKSLHSPQPQGAVA